MKIKTSELTGAALDWAVAKCEGVIDRIELEQVNGVWSVCAPEYECMFEPSTCWTQGGPIIERERMTLRVDTRGGFWVAFLDGDHVTARQRGETSLIAAMRCYVASKLGEEVEVPDELS